jgi:predicted DNA-binding transcriptional regulator AlpA
MTGRKIGIRELTKRYGVSARTIDRWLADPDLGFPKPCIVINGRRYWDLGEIEQWERAHAVRGR